MQVCTSLQTDDPSSTPPLSFLQAGCPSCRPTNSVKALKATIDHTNKISSKQPKSFFTFDVSTLSGLHQKKLVLGLLPVLGATSMSRAKKAVVRITELVAPFVPVHGSWTFLPDMVNRSVYSLASKYIYLNIMSTAGRQKNHKVQLAGDL